MDQVREYITACSVPVTPESGAAGPGPGPGSGPGHGPGHGPSPGPSGLQAQVPVSCVSSRILSRNANVAMTSQPTNESELQLYRVLQRANLLSYYDTFICQGGDDVQQLCEAGEEEFLEIMALVGMASKPLHVRRLQKALQEWVNNPAMFQTPLIPSIPATHSPYPVSPGPTGVRPGPLNLSQQSPVPMQPSPPMPVLSNSNSQSSPSPGAKDASSPQSSSALSFQQSVVDVENSMSHMPWSSATCQSVGEYPQGPVSPTLSLTPVLVDSQIQRLAEAAEMLVKTLPPFDPKPQNNKKKICKDLEYVMNMPEDDPRRMDEIRKYAAIYGRFDCKRKPEKPLTLHEVSVNEAAAQICKHIPALLTRRDELFPLARQVVRDSGYQYSKGHSSTHYSTKSLNEELVWALQEGKIDGFNKNVTRKLIMKLNSSNTSKLDHQVTRNISDEDNSVLSKNLRLSQCYTKTFDDDSCKRLRFDGSPGALPDPSQMEDERKRRQDRLDAVTEQLKLLAGQQHDLKTGLQQSRDAHNVAAVSQIQAQLDHLATQHYQLVNEQSELSRQLRRLDRYFSEYRYGLRSSCSETDKVDTDDTDSQFSVYSYESSASLGQEVNDSPSHDSNQSTQANDAYGGSKNNQAKKTNAQITKQLVQETLIDEGLRVVKELASQIKDESETNASPAKPEGRPRGRPPRLERDYILTTAGSTAPGHCINSSAGSARSTPTPVTPMQNGHSPISVGTHSDSDSPSCRNGMVLNLRSSQGPEMNSVTGNGVETMSDIQEDIVSSESENSLKALLAFSQKGIKQEPSSPNSLIKMD